MSAYQPRTGEQCSCRPGIWRDNCPACEGTGWRIDFTVIRRRSHQETNHDRDLPASPISDE